MTDFSLQNINNRANGQYFEDMVSEALEYYWEKGFAAIEKTPEPMRPVKRLNNNTFHAIYTKRAQPDYKGVLLGGQAIIFEAKYTSTEKIEQKVVTEAQVQCFERYEKLGAQCYVMVCLQDMKFYRVPWNVWKGMKQIFGHKYMNEENLEKYKVSYSGGVVRLLDGIELLEYR